MTTANVENKLVVTDPDFNTIKTNLKNFLRSQSTFSDYDFEGSALSNLIDLLAYNTHYMAFYANMIANESFLDTASIRDSVVSHAKMLGYTPHSTKSAIAKMNLSFTDTSASTSLTLPRFTRFSSSAIDGVNYMFTNLEEKTVTKDSGEFKFINLYVTEGTPVNYIYTYNSSANPQSEFEIPDASVDTSTIQVVVQNSSSDLTQATYTLATDATELTGDSEVYFLDEIKNQKYKLYFGNGTLGKALSDGNVVIISYLISKGSAANKANNLTLLDSLYANGTGNQVTNPVITMLQAAAGGTEIESIQNIKYAAPKSYISNNRAVTKNDYISLIQKKYPSLEAVTVWGGEENIPPAYGKVFISAKPAYGYDISTTEKQYIIDNIINPMSIMTVTPEFVNPDYTYLRLDIRVTYDPTATTKTAGQIESTARNAVYNYALNNLNKFNSYFKLSRLSREIDNSDQSILSSEVSVILEKRLEPLLGISRNYTIDFHTELKRSSGRNRIRTDTTFTMFDLDYNLRYISFEEIPSSFSGISSATVQSSGSNLTTAPTLVVVGDGTGAELEAIITNGKVTQVKVKQDSSGKYLYGSEYSTAKVVAYDSDGIELTDVVIVPVLDNAYGQMRTFFFDDNQVKTIFNDTDAGEIDYVNGKITLNKFTPLDVDNDLKVIKFFAEPETALFVSDKHSILTLDVEDISATKISIIPVK